MKWMSILNYRKFGAGAPAADTGGGSGVLMITDFFSTRTPHFRTIR